MPLEHVSMRRNGNWERITAREAAALNPYGTVSSQSELFRCEKCGQYVILTNGYIRDRYFKHSKDEKDKNCIDRTFGNGVCYDVKKRELPLRIVRITPDNFDLEIGFVSLPHEVYNIIQNTQITITDENGLNLKYNASRISSDSTSYLSLNGSVSQKYSISARINVSEYWPGTVTGADPNGNGTIFDAETGKKILCDADVQVNKEYYLLSTKMCFYSIGSVCVERISSKRQGYRTWYVFSVKATQCDENAVRFFMDFSCRLTDAPLRLQPIWPPFIEEPYIIKHSKGFLYFYQSGRSTLKTKSFPMSPMREYDSKSNKVIYNSCIDRQQLITTGSTSVLKYYYLRQSSFDDIKIVKPDVSVKTVDGEIVEQRNINFCSKYKLLILKVSYDGFVSIYNNGICRDIFKISNDKNYETEVKPGDTISISQGLDIIWKACFLRAKSVVTSIDEQAIITKLDSYRDDMVLANHSLGAIVNRLTDYPQIRLWLYKAIRDGKISRKALRCLVKMATERKG